MYKSKAEMRAGGKYINYITNKMREMHVPTAIHIKCDKVNTIELIGENSAQLYSQKDENIVAGLKKLSKFVRSQRSLDNEL